LSASIRRHLSSIAAKLSNIPCIGGSTRPSSASESGVESILGTVTWSFAADEFRRRHGFAAVSGTEADVKDGVLTGLVKHHFDEWDKLSFVRSHCDANQIDLSQCIAVGDSRSDVPLFRAAGFSVALNATVQAREAATVALDADSLTDVLAVIPRD
jgi:phosphoserine phosphatase